MTSQITPTAEHELQPIPDWPAQRARNSVAIKEEAMTRDIDWTAVYAALSEPFEPSLIRYRAGATNRDKTQALALPYVDPRAYEDRLNTLVPGDWHVTFEPWGNDRIICRLTIHGVTRSSTGEAGDSPEGIAGTSAESQSFKRACAKFGLGRHLYATAPHWAPYDAKSRCLNPNGARGTPSAEGTDATGGGLGRDRANRMHQELRQLGLARSTHLDYAGQVLHKRVLDLAVLTSAEASIVWRAAIGQAHDSSARRGTHLRSTRT